MNVEVDDGTTIQQIKRIRTESGELEKESLNGEEIDSRSYTLLKNVEKCNVTTNHLLEPTQTAAAHGEKVNCDRVVDLEKSTEKELTLEEKTNCRKSRSRSSSTSSSSSSRSSSSSSSASSNTSSSSSNSSSPEQHSSKLDAATPSSSPKPSSSKEHATPSASSPKPSTSKKHVDSSSPSSTPSKPHTTLSTSPSKPNYRISPINTDESDVDLSDSDPTFKLNNNTVNDASSSEFVSDSANIENTEKKKKTRKRLRNPSKWKQNIVKELRNTGKAYQSLSKTKKNISARSIKEKCNCKLKCGGPIYTPYQYITIIKSARKSGKPFTVREMNHNCFFDLKQLQEQWAYNFNEGTEKNKLTWNDIKVLQFLKEEPYSFRYKTSYSQTAFHTVNMRNKRKKTKCDDEIILQRLYEQPIPLKENKIKDLKNLLNKNQIPHYYANFYDFL